MIFLRPVPIPNYTLQRRLAPVHSPYLPSHSQATLTEIYIEALLVDEELADQVWEAWDAGEADDQTACKACMLIAGVCSLNDQHGDN